MDFRPVEENLRQSFRILAGHREDADVRELGGVTIASLGASFQMFNAVFLNSYVEDQADLERRVLLASVHFAARGIDWAFWLCDPFLDRKLQGRVKKIFSRMGLKLSSQLPAMAADSLGPSSRQLPLLDIRRVEDAETRRAFCEIGSVCFHVPLPWFEEVFDERMEERAGFVAWVASVNGEPVATAATVVASGVIGVYNVATLPGHRGRGVAEALVRFAVGDASVRSGLSGTVLQSTSFGYDLYRKMGYRVVGDVLVFTS